MSLLVPVTVALLVTSAVGSQAPTALHWMAQLGPWNYAIAFAFMITGLLLTMRWH